MKKNSFGEALTLSTWGESHGTSVGCVLDGVPSGLELNEKEIQRDLDRRRPGQSDITTSRNEEDKIEILSGVFEGITMGTPIGMLVRNKDADSSKYKAIIDTPRPGHADLAWQVKFGVRDWRGGGRSSARETIGRVAGGAVAKKILSEVLNCHVLTYTKSIGNIEAKSLDVSDVVKAKKAVYGNSVRCLDRKAAGLMEKEILLAKEELDSLGGIVELVILGCPAGLGEPVFGKMNSELAGALMSIPGVKGVEIGAGFSSTVMRGSEFNDEIDLVDDAIVTKTNNAGGITGGITNGMPIVARVAFRPTASISKEQKTVDLGKMKEAKIKIEGRHDPCIVPRAVPVVEAMAALTVADLGLRAGEIPRTLL